MSSPGNFDKLHYVYYQAAPDFLRRVFCELWVAIEGTEWEDDKANGKKLMSVKGVVGVVKGGKLQKTNVESGNSLLWDLSLLADILLVLHKENLHVVLPSFDLSVFTKNLESLKGIRNKLAHAGTIQMNSETFKPLWNETERILTAMGMRKDLLERPTIGGEMSTSAELSENAKIAENFKLSGNLLFKNGDFVEAAVEYSKGINLEDVPQELLGTLYANRAITFLELGEVDSAKDDAKSVITLRPNWFRGYTRLGQTYEKAEKFSKAGLNFDVAVHLGDTSKSTADSLEYCKMMVAKLKRSEATDPDMMKQKELGYNQQLSFISKFLGNEQTDKFIAGTPIHLCKMGHRFYWGREGCQQDFQKAADFFGQAASLGDAEGLYNLGLMMREGKGVERDVLRGHQLLLEAAGKPPIVEVVVGSSLKRRNIGVMEAWHSLGIAYDTGTVVKVDQRESLKWYLKAVEFGNGMSANNISIIYDNNGNPGDFQKGVDFGKLSAYLGTVRGAENLAFTLRRRGLLREAQEWYHYAIHMGSMDLKVERNAYVADLSLERSFDPESFSLQLEKDVKSSKTLTRVLEKIEEHQKLEDVKWANMLKRRTDPKAKVGEQREEAIRRHRDFLSRLRSRLRDRVEIKKSWTAPPTLLPTSSGVDLVGLKEIFFKEMEKEKENRVFSGNVLKVEVIEDAVLGNPSVGLLVEDSKGDVGRLFVYNYPQRKETQGELGYGCRLTIIYPHYRTMDDGKRGLRVDDPQLIFRHEHLRNPNRCRYCGTADGGKVVCRKCRRVTYCSKICLQKDAKEREHSLVCFKSLDSYLSER